MIVGVDAYAQTNEREKFEQVSFLFFDEHARTGENEIRRTPG